MPTLREKIAGLLRNLPSHSDSSHSKSENPAHAGSAPQESFIQKYLNGQLKRNQPEIIFGKCCYDLPMKKVAKLSKVVLASHTGPAGGLTQVNRKQKPFEYLDLDVDFIDEDYEGSSENINKLNIEDSKEKTIEKVADKEIKISLKQDSPDEVAGIKNWSQPDERAYGIATSLYEKHPVTNANAGEPLADAFAVCLRENSAVLVLADGVNWGEKSCLAARCAVHGCMDYLNNALYREGGRIETTMDVFVCLLRSFHAAHNLILQEEGNLTTLCAAVTCQIRNSDKFIVCTCNVGDSLAYIYSHKHGVREITQGSHDINSMRDMRDALGALGPVDGVNPELNNLTVSMTIVEQGDYVFLCSDGISDNFDPVVGKFALPKRPEKPHRKSSEVPKLDASKTSIKRQNSNSQEVTSKRQSRLNAVLRRQNNNNNNNEDPKKSGPVVQPIPQEPTLPVVEAHQRHQLTLLRMEDLLNNGQNDNDKGFDSSQKLCDILIDFAMKLTVAKRKILEDPDLYQNDEPDSTVEQRSRRRKVGDKLCTVPGKLDHASVVACRIGNYKPHSPIRRSTRDTSKNRSKSPVATSNKSKSSSGHHHHHHGHHHHHHHHHHQSNNNNNNVVTKTSRGMKTDDNVRHLESSI